MRDRYRFLLTTLFLCNVFLCELAIASPLHVPQYLSGGTGRNIRHLPCVSRRTGETGVCMFAFTCAKANGTHLGTCIDRFYFGSCCKIDDELTVSPQDNAIDDGPLRTKLPSLTTPNAIESNDIPEYIPKPKPLSEDKPTVSITTRIPSSSTQKITTKRPSTTTVEVPNKLTTFQTVQTVSQSRPTTPASTYKPSSKRPVSSSTHRPSTVPQTTYVTTERTSPSSSVVFQTTESTTEKTTETTKKSSVVALITTPFTRFPPRNSTTVRPTTTSTKRPSTVTTKKPASVPKPPRPSLTSKRPTTSTKKPSSVVTTTKRPIVSKKPVTKRPTTTSLKPSTSQKPSSSETLASTQSFNSTTKAPIKKPEKVTTTTEKILTTVKVKPSVVTKKPVTTKRPVTATSVKVTSKPTTKPVSSTVDSLTSSTTMSTTKVTVSKPASSVPTTLTTSSSSALPSSTSVSSSFASSPSSTVTLSSSTSTVPVSTTLHNLTEASKVPLKDTTSRPMTTVGLVTWTSNSDELVTTKVPEVPSSTEAPTTTGKWTSTTAEEWVFIPPLTTQNAEVNETTPKPFVTFADRPTTPVKPELDKVATESTTKKTTIKTTTPATTSSTTVSTTLSHMMDYTQVCGRRLYPEPRIVGGDRSSFGKWPWQISLRQWKNYYAHKCGAALLNENWAITAAHCVQGVPKEDILLRMGETDTTDKAEPYGYIERRVHLVVPHQQFDPVTYEYDLALLRFDQPILPFQPNVLPVCVPDDDESYTGQMAYVTGWGRLRHEDSTEPLPNVLQEVAVPVLNNTICEAMYRSAGYIEHIPYIFICAGWKKGGHDSCEGDSGGPMVIQRPRDKRWVLAGIISWGIGCAAPNQPGVYTRISEFRDWINQILPF